MGELEMLACGYGLLEGPRADDKGNLYFSDVPNGGVFRRSPDGTIETVIPKRRGIGGIAFHASGGLVVGGRDVSHVRDGVSRVLFALDGGGPNDLFTDAAGRVIFGSLRANPMATTGANVPGECWRINAEGVAEQLYDGVLVSNGIGFSPDGSVLYHSDTATHGVWAHDYSSTGSVSGRRLLVKRRDLMSDGLAVDEAGTVWLADVSGSASVRGFSPSGEEVGRIAVPAKMVTSLCFGGADRRDLYIVTADNTDDPARKGSIFRTRADVAGCAVTPVSI